MNVVFFINDKRTLKFTIEKTKSWNNIKKTILE